MTLFVDASALVAIVQGEEDADALAERLGEDRDRLTSAIALWETGRVLMKDRRSTADETMQELVGFQNELNIKVIPVGFVETLEALRAHERYGKGTLHPARLNMGDCFAYACAKTQSAALLYKGNDFVHTDLK